ncbi:DGQHR domain-containing protein [Stutzerimonas stutzeri]|uniref:DGQHR domain-containing protein n=1 Tax=Stutzerimonas stutzeri TaxID=316 RepID=UPI001F56DEC9|nr:DGQHR domain-containing protein [Stutzerimonas stutzeri]UNL98721.1 DGQHR domain-containing protein [Stutzerimonas stutzeri]
MLKSVSLPVLRATQPIGSFYVGIIRSEDLVEISSADMRRIESELDRFVGIQRHLSKDRVTEIGKFVNSIDATFPTSVVLAVKSSCARFDENSGMLTLQPDIDEETDQLIPLDEIARILDGQHRVEGLRSYRGECFEVPVSIFIDADIADQAYIFATVNLAQTKVNRSLVYDLLDYSKARSPQKTAHDITIALDKFDDSPFKGLIKRLGTATPGRTGETLAQATLVNSFIPLISRDPEQDRYDLAKGKRVKELASSYQQTPFRSLWIQERDGDIAKILLEYFNAAKERWPSAWNSREKGMILVRTNGFRALIRLFKDVYLRERPEFNQSNPIISKAKYREYFERATIESEDFSTDRYKPGTSGETQLYKDLRSQLGFDLQSKISL